MWIAHVFVRDTVVHEIAFRTPPGEVAAEVFSEELGIPDFATAALENVPTYPSRILTAESIFCIIATPLRHSDPSGDFGDSQIYCSSGFRPAEVTDVTQDACFTFGMTVAQSVLSKMPLEDGVEIEPVCVLAPEAAAATRNIPKAFEAKVGKRRDTNSRVHIVPLKQNWP